MSKFKELSAEIGELVERKNKAYGNSFATCAKALELLHPEGIPVEKYQDVLIFVRMWDKHSRIAHEKEAFDESPYRDLCGYSLLGWDSDEAEKEKK